MSAKEQQQRATNDPFEGTLEALSGAIESGAGLPAVARAAGKALDASVALIDRSSTVLAVAAASADEEKKLLSGGPGRRGDRAPRRRQPGRRAALAPALGGTAGPGPAADGRHPARRWSSSARARPSGPPRRRPATSSARCSPARSPTAATSPRAPPSSAPTSAAGAGVLIGRAVPRSAQTGDWRDQGADPGGPRPPRGRPGRADGRGRRGERAGRGRRGRSRGHRRAAGARRRGAQLRARAGADRVRDHRFPQQAGQPTRSTSTGPGTRPASPPTSARRRAPGCSPSRTPAPTGCCCRR